MEYRRLYWGAVAGFGLALIIRHGPALFGTATQAGNLPPVIGTLGGIAALAGGMFGLYAPAKAGGPENPGLLFAAVVLAFLLQTVAVVGWLLGGGW